MTRTAVALGALVSLGAMLATVQVRIEIMREGYRRARLERRVETEQACLAVLAADYARRTGPARILELAKRHGLELVPPPSAPAPRPGSAPSTEVERGLGPVVVRAAGAERRAP